MRIKHVRSYIALLMLGVLASCTTVPITGRTQLNMVSDPAILSMSLQQYSDFLKTHKISTDAEQTAKIRQVGRRIQKGVEMYFAESGMLSELDGYKWEFNLVEGEEINAFCMPGGKVVVYTGLLSIAGGDDGLAVVMGHEIAHAVAKHGNERMSQALAMQMGGVALGVAMSNESSQSRQLWTMVYGLGASVGYMLPFSRLHEKEADHLGLIFMALAGYDPHTAIDFWQRMSVKQGGKKPPELLSTHPSDQTRIEAIRAFIPEAMTYYRP
ncbi:MAG: M48 family metallopeptidase [Desulfatirhabdiaceae bacterium]|nr:M48 family metallopeptidase [Desulfatirhabdiaceae bacterium]